MTTVRFAVAFVEGDAVCESVALAVMLGCAADSGSAGSTAVSSEGAVASAGTALPSESGAIVSTVASTTAFSKAAPSAGGGTALVIFNGGGGWIASDDSTPVDAAIVASALAYSSAKGAEDRWRADDEVSATMIVRSTSRKKDRDAAMKRRGCASMRCGRMACCVHGCTCISLALVACPVLRSAASIALGYSLRAGVRRSASAASERGGADECGSGGMRTVDAPVCLPHGRSVVVMALSSAGRRGGCG